MFEKTYVSLFSFPNVRASAKVTRAKKTNYVSQATHQKLTCVSLSEVSGDPVDFCSLKEAHVLINQGIRCHMLPRYRTAMF